MPESRETESHEALQAWLQAFLSGVDAAAGTVHLHETGGLRLTAFVNIPPPLQQAVQWVPSGKGMAGLALERGEPVQTCNIQEDRSGAIKPGAKAVNAKAAVALPVRNAEGTIIAVVGAAWMSERDLDEAELRGMQQAAASLADVPRG
jgi:L-methionine (R)-S-oxide reductase